MRSSRSVICAANGRSAGTRLIRSTAAAYCSILRTPSAPPTSLGTTRISTPERRTTPTHDEAVTSNVAARQPPDSDFRLQLVTGQLLTQPRVGGRRRRRGYPPRLVLVKHDLSDHVYRDAFALNWFVSSSHRASGSSATDDNRSVSTSMMGPSTPASSL